MNPALVYFGIQELRSKLLITKRAEPLTQIQSVEPSTGSPPLPPATTPEGKVAAPAEARSLLATAWMRIRRSKVALLSLCVVVDFL